MADLLVVQSKVKAMVKKQGCATGADAMDALSKLIEETLKKAVKRAKANRRKTLKGQDI